MDTHSCDGLKVVFKYPWCKGPPLDQRCDLVFLLLLTRRSQGQVSLDEAG